MADSDLMVRVNIDAAAGGMELLTPNSSLRWGRCRFVINPEPGGRADFAVTLFNARAVDQCRCAPGNTLLIVGEPREKKLYPSRFYRQFGHVVDSHADSQHPRLSVSCPGLNWHVGLNRADNGYRYGYDHLRSLSAGEQQNRIAVVCSDANKTAGERGRLALLADLKRLLGGRIVHFGRGFVPVDDKLDAIRPYRYHLVLENCVQTNYWTEKLADAYLGWSYPVYLGCPNLNDYFSSDAFVSINRMTADEAAAVIDRLLAVPISDQRLQALAEARERVLDRYNPFAWMASWVEALYRPELEEAVVTIRSHKAYRSYGRGWVYRFKRTAHRIADA
jgi:hypothetical protein